MDTSTPILQCSHADHAECLRNAGLQSQLLVPDDAEYSARQDSYCSSSARVKPACIFLPRSAEDVSIAVKALVAAAEKFAVRSGGCTNWPGSNNIEDGVTIDLSLLNTTIYDEVSKTASIGPGTCWAQVYAELQKCGRAVAGGRVGAVGVAGLLLGGGNTFFTARTGFACDNVVSYEVVLADGRIITADAQSNTDLFRALKGGSINFGIVTNFKMSTIKCERAWGGISIFPKETIPRVIEELSSFTNNIPNDIDSSLVCIFTYTPRFKDIVVCAQYSNVACIEKPPSFKAWLDMPIIASTVKITTVLEMALEYSIPLNYYNIWFTGSFKNDVRIIAQTSQLHDQLVQELKAFILDGDFITQCAFQPLPKLFAERSASTGGNVMGVERHKHNGLLLLATAMVRTAEQEMFVKPKMTALIQRVREFAATIEGGNLEWIYLNYADKSQNPLGSYGLENVRRIQDAATKYDPQQVFQKLCPGGFKISHVKNEDSHS